MNVGELKKIISTLPDCMEIVTHGYEGGFDIVSFCEPIDVATNINPGSSVYGIYDEIQSVGVKGSYYEKPVIMHVKKVLLIADEREGRGSGF